ncbi:hypothetical protein [Allobranchiibius sp. GilTou38]|uniref:hypothetical protein n=1 Tax=Allobranchiibius sp. GilTou38 TaxID=2815210 RepID=UPI001AA12108|nr:hypothetical protein [Allobranchiibius sp. GilTou38]MBO1767062.1 hypothetical protein [Allobranchiibius sp. GilTou38]
MSTQVLPSVKMPQLSGGRARARALASPLQGRMREQQVRLDCRQLVAGTASFADEIVRRVLLEGGADRLVVEYAGPAFGGYLQDAARDLDVSASITFVN